MLAQEAAESAAAVNALLQKMKQMKQKLTLELQREKHTAQLLQEEAIVARKQREDLGKDLRVALDDLARTREQLKDEQTKNVALLHQNGELRAAEMKSKAASLE